MARTLTPIALLILLSLPLLDKAQTATITWADVHQTIDGFGASDWDRGFPLTSAQGRLLFSTSSGVGLSLLRTGVPSDGSCATINRTCAGNNSNGVYVSDMQLAISYGAKVWSTSWSPPTSMLTNASKTCSLSSDSYGSYATYLSNFISSVRTLYSIPLYAISPQNEPDWCAGTAPPYFRDTDFDNFIKNNLGPTLAANGQGAVRIMMPEPAHWVHWSAGFVNEANTCMGDPSCYNYVGINSWHDYDDYPEIVNPYSSLKKAFWETEASAGPSFGPSLCGGCWDPSMANGLLWARIIDSRLAVSNANAWNYWWFISVPSDNEGLINSDGATTSKTLYVMGNYSKFVRPGWVRIGANHVPVSGVTVSAYKDPSGNGTFAIVATNQNSSATNVTFSLSGFSATSVTPWVTSASLDLAQQPSIYVGGSTFSATLPAASVTTFVGSAGSGPAPPTITGNIVH